MIRPIGAASLVVTLCAVLSCGAGERGAPAGPGAGASPWPEGRSLPTPPSYLPDPIRTRLGNLAQEVAQALCDRAATCCPSLKTRPNAACLEHAALVWSRLARISGAAARAADLEYDFDETRAAACRERLRGLQKDCGFDVVPDPTTGAPALLAIQATCGTALSVWVRGQPRKQCWTDVECLAEGAGRVCGENGCVSPGGVGAPCASDPFCAAELACDGQRCQPRLAAGARCSRGLVPGCAARLACKNDVCVVSPGPGERCEGIVDCAAGLRCVPASQAAPTGAGTCRPFGPWHQPPCDRDWQCQHECVKGWCDPRLHHFCVDPY